MEVKTRTSINDADEIFLPSFECLLIKRASAVVFAYFR
jgi:hypothetical protein